MEDNKDLKKKIVSTATALSLMVGGAFSPPADLPENPNDRISPPAIIEIAEPVFIDDDDDGDSIAIPDEEKKRKGLRARVFTALPIIAVTWIGGIALAAFATAALTPFLAKALSWIITAVLILVTYAAVSKVMFPDLKLKQILSPKALLIVLAGATAATLIAKGISLFL